MSNITSSQAAAALGSVKSAAKAKSSAANGAKGGRPVEYTRFNSYGFLRVKRWDADRGEYVHVGSFAGEDAPQRADECVAADKAARKAKSTPKA